MLPARCFITILVLNISWVNCMILRDILDFSAFLETTSLVDKPRIDGVVLEGDEHGGAGESEEDDAPHPDAWEQSGKFEGDIILNARQRRLIVEDVAEGLSRNGLKDFTKRWPNNELVYYIQKEHFSDGHIQAIMDGLDDIARSSCITFRPYKKGDPDAVVIQGSRRGCFSAVGYQSGYQVLNLSGRHPLGRGCFRHGTVVHEMLHSLGFYHMQSSPDRDDYIDVKWENIIEGAKHNFRKYNTLSVTDFGIPYDYDSVLHYSKRAFSTNGKPTLVPKKGGAGIGQRRGMSDSDVEKLNKMYCDKDSGSSSFDDTKDVPKKAATKKKPNTNKPFEGQGLGYYKGKSIIVKLPKLETLELNENTFEDITSESKDAKQEQEKLPNHKSVAVIEKTADDDFKDTSKRVAQTRYPSELHFNDFISKTDPVEKPSYQNDKHLKETSTEPSYYDKYDDSQADKTSEYGDDTYSKNEFTPFEDYSRFKNNDLFKNIKSNDHATETTPQQRYNDYVGYVPKYYSSEETVNDPVGSRYGGYKEDSNYKPEQTKPSSNISGSLKSPVRYDYDNYYTRSNDKATSSESTEPTSEDFSKEHDAAETHRTFDLYSIPAEVKDLWGGK